MEWLCVVDENMIDHHMKIDNFFWREVLPQELFDRTEVYKRVLFLCPRLHF